MTLLAPRIVNDVSYVTRIDHEIHFAHQALTSLNENVREKKAALAVKHAWRQHVLTIVTERPTAFCCHLFRRQSRSSKEAACRGG